jgi:hypothetical protein
MNKKFLLPLLVLLFLAIPTSFILAQGNPAQLQVDPTPTPLPLPPDAQPTPLPNITEYDNQASFTFANIGEETTVLRYPGQQNLYANFPNQWQLIAGVGDPVKLPPGASDTLASSRFSGVSFIEIHYDFADTATEESTGAEETSWRLQEQYPWISRPGIEIYVNEILIGMFIPEVGTDLRVQMPIPPLLTMASAENPFNEYNIEIAFYGDGDIYCNYDGVLTIYDDSSININYNWRSAFRVLSNLPRPLVQDTFIPETLALIVSDQPTEADLEAITWVSSSIAQNSFTNINFEVFRGNEVTQEDLAEKSAVIIGSPAENSFLRQLYDNNLLPSGLSSNGSTIIASNNPVAEETGVLQIIPSNVNQLFTFVTITGETDMAITRAAKAFANPPIGANYQLMLVDYDFPRNTGVTPLEEVVIDQATGIEASRSLFTFETLGYRERTSLGIGLQRFFISFYVPRDVIIDDDLTLTVNYLYSDAIDRNSSNMAVYMNNQPVGNLPMSETPTEIQTAEVTIKKENVVQGSVNVIRIDGQVNITLICEDYDPAIYWLTVFADSELTIPYTKVTSAVDIAPIVNPIVPFAFEPNHVVILGPNPNNAQMNALADVYNQFGSLNNSTDFDVTFSLEDDVDLSQYPDHDVLMIGLPTSSLFIEQINDRLPQPFTAGSNNLQQLIGQTAYQLVPGIDMGVIQAIPSQENPARMISLLTGTSEQGFDWGIQEILDNGSFLSGDLFFVQETTTNNFFSSLFSQAVLDSMVSEVLDEPEFVPVEEEETEEDGDTDGIVTTEGSYIRDEVTDSTRPILMIAGIALAGLLIIIYLGTRIASGGKRK